MRLLVTRPASQAEEWVQRLAAAGIDAVALPLIGIEPPADADAVRAAWGCLAAYRLVVFVSPNAAEQFMRAAPAGVRWPPATQAGSIGPGTTRALQRLGVPAACIVEPDAAAPQFDSEALWAQLAPADWPGARVLVVRGDGGREWLAETLRTHGAEVSLLAAYRRAAPRLDASSQALLQAALDRPHEHLWFFSSSEAIDHLAALAGPSAPWARSRALATHPRIAARAEALGFGRVTLSRPTLPEVCACIQSMPP